MYKWLLNPNVPTVTALRTAMELLNRNVSSADDDAAKVSELIGRLLTQAQFFGQLSLLLDKTVPYSLDTPQMVEALSCALLAMETLIMSTSAQAKTCLTTLSPSQWILKNKRDLFRACIAAEDFVDEGLNYHKL